MSTRQTVYDRLGRYVVDCGDNSCRFALKKGGMRTNGGCRCLSTNQMNASPVEKLAILQTQIIRELLDEVERLESDVQGYVEQEAGAGL